MNNKVTLREHLGNVDQNSSASPAELDSLTRRMAKKFKDCGYVKASKNEALVREYIDLIFKTQGYRCTHWIPVKQGELNGVWNRPGRHYRNWRIKQILYEIDHVQPVNAGGGDSLTNFQFLSSNANQFVKCSLTYEDLMKRVDLSQKLKDRINIVLEKRSALFDSSQWSTFVKKLDDYEKSDKN